MKINLSGDEIQIYDFNELEAYKIGRHLEEEGIGFYKNLIKESDSDDLRDSINNMISDEKKHLELLQVKIDSVTAQSGDGFEEDSIEDFLSTNVFSHFKDIKDSKDIFQDRQKAIEFGIMVESRSILFYEAILKNTKDENGKKAIQVLINEEIEHLSKLRTL